MNLTVEPTGTALPPPMAPPSPEPKGHRWLVIIGVVAGVAAIAGTIMAINDDDDFERTVQLAAASEASAGSSDAGTGDADIDEQIVDAIWESTAKASLCPSFNELKATLPTLSEDEIIDMGMSLADDMDQMAPGTTGAAAGTRQDGLLTQRPIVDGMFGDLA